MVSLNEFTTTFLQRLEDVMPLKEKLRTTVVPNLNHAFLVTMAAITNLRCRSFQLFLVRAAEEFSTLYSKAAVTDWLNMALKMLSQMYNEDEISTECRNQTTRQST